MAVLRLRARPGSLDDEDALRAAYAEHGGELFGYAYRSLDDTGLAEEAVQETFVRAWRSAQRFDPARAPLRAWLFAILRNVVIDLARARSVRPTLADAEPADHAAPTDDLERALMTFGIEEALQQVSERHRQVVVEVHLRGRPVAEVAQELGVPAGTVHSRLYYGLRALGVVLEEMGWLDER